MPSNKDCRDFSPEQFAKLMALFDTGNPSEAEAMNAARLIRRPLVAKKLRLVDVIYRTDVMEALDAQLQPVREENPKLKEAFLRIENLENLAKEREETIRKLRKKLSVVQGSTNTLHSAWALGDKLFNDGLVAAVSLGVVVLLIAAAFR
jgi:hypothetical protein